MPLNQDVVDRLRDAHRLLKEGVIDENDFKKMKAVNLDALWPDTSSAQARGPAKKKARGEAPVKRPSPVVTKPLLPPPASPKPPPPPGSPPPSPVASPKPLLTGKFQSGEDEMYLGLLNQWGPPVKLNQPAVTAFAAAFSYRSPASWRAHVNAFNQGDFKAWQVRGRPFRDPRLTLRRRHSAGRTSGLGSNGANCPTASAA